MTYDWLVTAFIAALLLWLTCNAIFASFFKRKEEYTDRLIRKMRGVKDGKAGK